MDTYTIIYQPNRLTEAAYKYTLLQERTLNAIVFHLQDYIVPQISKKVGFRQLDLFKKNNEGVIRLKIALNHIGKPNQYDRIRESIVKLAGVVVDIKETTSSGIEMIRYSGLLRANIPCNTKRNSYVIIEIEKKIATKLIELERNIRNEAINFTRYEYEICQQLKGKYAPKIFKLISSYQGKGEFVISLDRFRRILGIENKYLRYIDLQTKVLLPVQKELKLKAKLWYDCEQKGFVKKKFGEVSALYFFLYSQKLYERRDLQKDNIIRMLELHFSFGDTDIEEYKTLLMNPNNHRTLKNLILRADSANKKIIIRDKKAYLKECINNEFY
ncbi:replication initiation protein [Labilibacter marinus]|uniref:replication initiation protein n=1 Tax=Labilibacter marinus TaxID=1477105 RepID=UPI00094F548F|nr:replication initiation protein [Labilibacter marinus]